MASGQQQSNPQFLSSSTGEKQPGETSTIWLIWLTYGAFYFCRTNLSVAVPGMQLSPEEGGLGLDKSEIGLILGSWKLAYASGQLLNGQLSEKFSPRKLLAIGMLGSVVLNILFGFGTGLYFLIFVWACNGLCQSLGWTPCVRVIGNWIPILRRGKAIGIVGTGYQVTAGLTYIVSGAAVAWYGNWQGAVFIPPAILASAAVIMLLFLRETPGENSSDRDAISQSQSRPGANQSFSENIWLTFGNFALWRLGIALALLNACRYGFFDWGISHLLDMQQLMQQENLREMQEGISNQLGTLDTLSASTFKAALKYAVIAIGAVAGSYLTGWATDRFFAGRRAPVISCLLLVLAGLTIIYESVTRTPSEYLVEYTMGLLVLIGFCIYGPQVLLVGTAPADLAKHGTAAAAAGFVNCMGYLGAFAGDAITGWTSERFGWQVALYTWASWALLAAVVSATLWHAGGNSHEKPDIKEIED